MNAIQLIVGLGNPGAQYQFSRHNVGFLVIDSFLHDRGLDDEPVNQYQGHFFDLSRHPKARRLPSYWLKPQTYMNLSGRSVRAAMKSLNLEADQLLIVHDEMDIEPGRCKLRRGGGSAGHNGLVSVAEELKDQEFWRLRVGVGRSDGSTRNSTTDYLLDPVENEDELNDTIESGLTALKQIVHQGCEKAMQQINRRSARGEREPC